MAPARFRAVVALSTPALSADGSTHSLTPGMQVQGEVLEYLLSPVQKAFHEAGQR